ncbi:hypothetical protein AMS60_05465 [Bacillus sp. FJAT-21945]|nr:hypothetical protein AMS60_05465 [Bacillus sp. FJAT-21945]
MKRLLDINNRVEEVLLFDGEGGKVTKSSDDWTRNRQLILEILEEDVPHLIQTVEQQQQEIEQLKAEKEQAYHNGYKQGRFDELMDSTFGE